MFMRLLRFKSHVAKPRCRLILCADVFHQDSVANVRKWSGNVGTMLIHDALRLVLILDPGRDLSGTSLLCFARGGAASAAIAVFGLALLIALHAAIPIDGIVAQRAEHTRAINLRRQKLLACIGMSGTAEHSRFLATTDFMHDVCDKFLVI